MEMELDLSFLTIEERQVILGVLKRDEELRLAEQARKSALKTEINQLRQQSAVRVGSEQKTRQCARCHTELGRLFNRGGVCPKCKHQICPTCRVNVDESSTFSWLCSLCYKQRLLPAVAGDWFYAKIDERFKHEITGTYGSEVVRSSIRRLKSQDGLDHSARSNPFSPQSNGVKSGGRHSSSQPKLSNGSGSYEHISSERTVRRVQSAWLSSSGSEESDNDGENSKHPKTSTANSSLSARLTATDVTAETRSETGVSAAIIAVDAALLSQSEPGSKASVWGHVVPPSHSLDPAAMSPEEMSHLRAESAVEAAVESAVKVTALSGSAAYVTVEPLMQMSSRRSSSLASDQIKEIGAQSVVTETTADDHHTNYSDDHPENSDSKSVSVEGFGSGSLCGNNGDGTVAMSSFNYHNETDINSGPPKFSCTSGDDSDNLLEDDNANPEDRRIRTLASQLAYEAATKVKSGMSPTTRRKLSLTPELERKSPMIGRRELDISHRFLKSFSDSSSDESDSSDEGEARTRAPTTEELQNFVIEMPAIERRNLKPKLSVIKEDLSEDSPRGNSLKRFKEPATKLKLKLQPDAFIDTESSKLDADTPVTPGKYSNNWDEFSVNILEQRKSSWTSDSGSAEYEKKSKDADPSPATPDEEVDVDHYAADSIISPKPTSKKIDRRSAMKKKNVNHGPSASYHPSSQHAFVEASSPPNLFTFPDPRCEGSTSPEIGITSTNMSHSPSNNLAGAGDSLNVMGSGHASPTALRLHIEDSRSPGGETTLAMADPETEARTDIEAEEDESFRLSPDGCSPSPSRDLGTEDGQKPIVPVVEPTTSHTPVEIKIIEPKDDVDSAPMPGDGAEVQDEFDEEDIDNLFTEAKKARTPKLSGHLSVSTESLNSMVSEAGADYTKHQITGELQFSLLYSRTTGVLTLTIHQCRDLVAVNKKKKISDPYIKAYLVSTSQRTNKCKTKVKKGTINPRFDETFRYTLTEMDLHWKTLQMSVWSFHRVGQGDFLGEVNIPLSSFPFDDDSGQEQWLPLQSKVQPKKTPKSPTLSTSAETPTAPTTPTSPATPISPAVLKADPAFRVALQYLPGEAKGSKAPKGDLQVKIHSAKNLPPTKTGLPDPYVKCFVRKHHSHTSLLMPDKAKLKTSVVKKNVNPFWDETIIFHKLTTKDLAESSLEITLWDHDTFGYDDLLGALRFNLGKGMSHNKKVEWMDAKGQQKLIWESMINNPSNWVDFWFNLRH